MRSQADSKEKTLYNLAQKEPKNPNAHLKLAEIYQKKVEKQKAISEYFLAADIFAKKQFYARAISIYKQLTRRDPHLDQAYLKMAEIYREKGFLAESLAQYRTLVHFYEERGEREKALNIAKIIDDLNLPERSPHNRGLSQFFHHSDWAKDPQTQETSSGGSFDLSTALLKGEPLETDAPKEVHISESIDGAERIFNELNEISGPNSANPYFNYNMGVAYREFGFCDQAMEQFRIAFKMGQKPFEALSMLGFCYWEKGMLDDAQQSLERALGMEGIPQEKKLSAKYILSLIYQELGREEIALSLLQEIATADKAFLSTQDEPICPAYKSGGRTSS